MKVLVLNCGSYTLKFKVFELGNNGLHILVAHGIAERIGGQGTMIFVAENSAKLLKTAMIVDYADATRKIFDWLGSLDIRPDAVGHRVVHGGRHFLEPALIDDDVIAGIEALRILAPLHNEPSLKAIRTASEVMGSSVPMVAVFDTAFHAKMPEYASLYAIPEEIAERHSIKRYGFHGIAHRYMVERYSSLTGRSLDRARLITLQLGNGCSATAVKEGHSIDTTMGLTPLEGLMMGTRSGDVDPHLPGFLAKNENMNIEQVEELLNKKSGLLGVSGLSQDMRELLKAEKRGDKKASLAVNMFCYRVRKQIGAYLAALGGADAVIFGGGIGENSPEVRARICEEMEWCGLILDDSKNIALKGIEGRITDEHSKIHAYVMPVDEEFLVARETIGCINKH